MIWWAALVGCDRQEPADDPIVAPCAGETWGPITDPEGAIHVRTTGVDSTDEDAGLIQAPFLTLAAALEATREVGAPKRIAIGPGEFASALDLIADDAGLEIVGCGPSETVLLPAAEQPQLKVTAATDVAVTGLTVRGGESGLWFWGGAEVTVTDVAIDDGDLSGFVVDGPFTIVEMHGVVVSGTRAVGGVGGYGGEVQGATLRWTGGGAWGNTAVGVVASGETATLELTDVEISDTLADGDGAFGRGVQVQSYATAALVDCTLVNNRDAGVFSLLGEALVLERVTVEQTAGDGIVVTGVDSTGRQLDPATFTVTLDGNAVSDPDRAGIVLERVTGVVNGNQVTGATQTVVAQEGAVVSGADAVEVLAVPLELNREAIGGVLVDP